MNPWGLATAAAISAVAGAVPVPAQARIPELRATQPLVEILGGHTIRAAPRSNATRLGTVGARRPITGGPTVLPVLRRTSAGGRRWLQIRVPGRPNSGKGWITANQTRRTKTTWHLVVRIATRRLLVYRKGRRLRTFSVVVGKPSTPTPRGRFFVEESVRMPPGHAGAPFALALSARSNVLQEFAGGPGQVALHGVANLAGAPGTAVSHGCVRLARPNIVWLARRIAPGTPVTITR